MKNVIKLPATLAAAATVIVLAPFLNKAFHIDDTLFLWIGKQISKHPGDPYGFSVNWNSTEQAMSTVMQNPPLNAYYVAVAARFLGWSEWAMHFAFLLPAVAAILGVFFLARRLTTSPLLAALLTLLTPVFLVSATSIMSDVLLLALWVWSIECWLRGLEKNDWRILALASVLATAAALTKYFGISLAPLLAVFTVVRNRRLTFHLLYLLIPLLAMAAYEIATKAAYGQGMLGAATIYPWTWNKTGEKSFFKTLLTGLSFTGGCLVSALFFARFLNRKLLVAGAATFVTTLLLSYFFLAREFALQGSSPWPITVEGALFMTTAIGIVALAVADFVQARTAESLLLCLWVLGTFLFATFLNWSVTSRTLLPIAPAVAILLVRQFRVTKAPEGTGFFVGWVLLPVAAVSLLVTVADYRLANTARTAASRFQELSHAELGTVWFEGHWGFQYYMEKWGAKPLDALQASVLPGDVIVLPTNNTGLVALSREHTMDLDRVEYAAFPFFTIMTKRTGAGFYSSVWGPLPWAVTAAPAERYYLYRAK